MNQKPLNRRRRRFVDPAVQGRMVLQLSWPSAAALAIAAVLFAVLSLRVADEAMAARIELPSLVPMLFTLVGFLVVALGFLLYHALKLSYRVAGPIYRLRRSIDAARAGDLTVRAHLREHDYMHDLADSLNCLLGQLERAQRERDDHATGPQAAATSARDMVNETLT